MPARSLLFGLYYEHYLLDRAYQHTQRVDDPQQRSTRVQIASLVGRYGITFRWQVGVTIPYNIRERRELIGADPAPFFFEFNGRGIGDLSFLTQFTLLPYRVTRPQEVGVGVGIKFPTGEHRKDEQGAVLPRDIQPGSGSVDWNFWANYLVRIRPVTILANAAFQLNGRDDLGYRFGNALAYSVTGGYPVNSRAEIVGQVKGRYQWRDHLEDAFGPRSLPNTGGNRIYLLLGVRVWPLASGFSLLTLFQLPIYQNVNSDLGGSQLGMRHGLIVNTQYEFRW